MHRTIEQALADYKHLQKLLNEQRELIANAEKTALLILEQINDAKRSLYAKGWTDS